MKNFIKRIIRPLLLLAVLLACSPLMAAKNNESVYYPRTRSEIKKALAEIKARKTTHGFSRDDQVALNNLNTFRYLCGLANYDVKLDEKMREEALLAAQTCRKADKISHDIGGNTERCNLYQTSAKSNSELQIDAFINDPGDNNRKERGHRMWCLYPHMKTTAFGNDGKFGAMRVVYTYEGLADSAYSYPGRGFFPSKSMLGNGWSYYPPKGIKFAGKNVKVSMWKLSSTPVKPFDITKDLKKSEGKVVEVPHVFIVDHGLTFEPKIEHNKGIFLIRIVCEGFSDQYVVHFI